MERELWIEISGCGRVNRELNGRLNVGEEASLVMRSLYCIFLK